MHESAETEREALQTYLELARRLAQCERDVAAIVARVREIAGALEHWRTVYVLHAGAGFPKEVTMTGRAIDASKWPTADELADALGAWHASAETVRTAWARLSAASRASAPPPP